MRYFKRTFINQSVNNPISSYTLGMKRTRTAFVGIGLNLSQLLFGDRLENESLTKTAGRNFFEHIQLPTYATINKNKF